MTGPADRVKDAFHAAGLTMESEAKLRGDLAEVARRLVVLVEMLDGATPLQLKLAQLVAGRLLEELDVPSARALVKAAFQAPEDEEEEHPAPPPPPDPEALLAVARPVLTAPDILANVAAYVQATGFAGDTGAVEIVYLALTSRLLPRPVNVLLAGQSASGKNHCIKVVLPLFPPEAFYSVTGQSPLAVVYSEEEFRHRTLVVAEAAAFHEDGIGASLLRALAWDAELTYITVIDGAPVRLHKDGPTGLITTSTRDVEPELATRLWTVPIPDDPEHTRKVLRVEAREVSGLAHPVPASIRPVEAFIALQRWLAVAGTTDVVIPFAERLAEKVPADEVRLRRDFTQLLGLIRTHAILHQCQRERDDRGRIVATLVDYERVRGLVEPIIAVTVAPGLSPKIREVVEVVGHLAPPGTFDKTTVTVREIAQALHLSDKVTWVRVQKALKAHHLVNEETRRYQPAKLRLGDPLPAAGQLLPPGDDLVVNGKTTPPTDGGTARSTFTDSFTPGGIPPDDDDDGSATGETGP